MEKAVSNSEMFNLVANGNENAARFLATFVGHCHVLDDIIDKDKPITDCELIRSETLWLLQLTANPWFIEHKSVLLPLIIQGFNAWLDSNRLAQSANPGDRVASDVLKGLYHEVVWHTAFLCGGWDRMRSLTMQHRAYDFEAR